MHKHSEWAHKAGPALLIKNTFHLSRVCRFSLPFFKRSEQVFCEAATAAGQGDLVVPLATAFVIASSQIMAQERQERLEWTSKVMYRFMEADKNARREISVQEFEEALNSDNQLALLLGCDDDTVDHSKIAQAVSMAATEVPKGGGLTWSKFEAVCKQIRWGEVEELGTSKRWAAVLLLLLLLLLLRN